MKEITTLQTEVVTFQEADEALRADNATEMTVHVPFPIKQP